MAQGYRDDIFANGGYLTTSGGKKITNQNDLNEYSSSWEGGRRMFDFGTSPLPNDLRYTPGQEAPKEEQAPAPVTHQAGGSHQSGGGSHQSGGSSLTDTLMSIIDRLLGGGEGGPQKPEEEVNKYGLEDTVLTRRVLPGDEESRRRHLTSLSSQRNGDQRSTQVVDPITGRVYPNPRAAERDGVKHWLYEFQYRRVATTGNKPTQDGRYLGPPATTMPVDPSELGVA